MRFFLTQVVAGQAAGGSFKKPKKEFAYKRDARRVTNQCYAQTEFLVHTSLQMCAGGGEVMCCDVMWYDVM